MRKLFIPNFLKQNKIRFLFIFHVYTKIFAFETSIAHMTPPIKQKKTASRPNKATKSIKTNCSSVLLSHKIDLGKYPRINSRSITNVSAYIRTKKNIEKERKAAFSIETLILPLSICLSIDTVLIPNINIYIYVVSLYPNAEVWPTYHI